ncbi:YciI family protein [Pararobbsia silviterrae]|uniref:Dehydrogenase n=1 Tax=Pararobbsia silviterrae TaxID=1792498 RepID=A0A494Y945_9BURK|nr:YciI family protein [Pararobbsia silviterrae]RKP59222.1 dehydrogenase [Pararobbsia silviterrae]
MSYLLLIVEPAGHRDTRPIEAGREAYARMLQFTDTLKSRGVLQASHSLTSDKDAVRVQMREGETRLVDGPFAEAKEMIGGFFLLDCDTHEEALQIARECPAVEWGTVEVRQTGPCCD